MTGISGARPEHETAAAPLPVSAVDRPHYRPKLLPSFGSVDASEHGSDDQSRAAERGGRHADAHPGGERIALPY
jgi:hypothetical protein